jgi:hypothetical protein
MSTSYRAQDDGEEEDGMDGECSSCGGAIDEGDDFCRHCGAEQ